MMKHITAFLAWCLLFVGFFPSMLIACSLREGFILPTNYELVKTTNAIVLAKATKHSLNETADEHMIDFKILNVLKGDIPVTTLKIEGYLGFEGRSEKGDFSQVRPGAYSGSCIAMDYRLRRNYALFLNVEHGTWNVSSTPFSRVNEEVDGMQSPWVQAIQHYVAVSALHNYEQEKAALQHLLVTHSQEETPSIPGFAEDITRHFQQPSPHKSFDDNLALFQQATTVEAKTFVLWAYVNAKDEQARPLIQSPHREW